METLPCHIPVAELHPVYSVAEVDRAMEGSAPTKNEGLKSWYEKMRALGGNRFIIKPTATASLAGLYDKSPNFTEVLDDLKKFMALAIVSGEPMHFLPMLLLGEPGLGKTYFAKALANAVGTGFEFVPMNSLTAGWILSGASSQWQNARPGKVNLWATGIPEIRRSRQAPCLAGASQRRMSSE